MVYTIERVFNYNRYEREFKKDDIVKLSFTQNGKHGESMWVTITEVKENTYFKGKLDNIPLSDEYPKLGEEISFDVSQIIRVFEL